MLFYQIPENMRFLLVLLISVISLNSDIGIQTKQDDFIEITKSIACIVEFKQIFYEYSYEGVPSMFVLKVDDVFPADTKFDFKTQYGKLHIWPADELFFYDIRIYFRYEKFEIGDKHALVELSHYVNDIFKDYKFRIVLKKSDKQWNIIEKEVLR